MEMSARGTHARVLSLLLRLAPPNPRTRVLDIGAGTGALSARLAAAGYDVAACDLYPEEFRVPNVECLGVDAGGLLPYADGGFDVAIAVELVEHIDHHAALFAEVRRILRPGGMLAFTTPNILSLKSRVGFLFTGYLYSFPSLDPAVLDPVAQHISPFSLDRYRWRLAQAGLDVVDVTVDRYQNTSRWLAFLVPAIWLINRRAARHSPSVRLQNSLPLLFGRKLFVAARRRG